MINEHAKLNYKNPIRFQPYTMSYGQSQNADCGKDGLLQGQELIVQFQMISTESTHTSNIKHTEKIILRNTHTHLVKKKKEL